MQDLFENHHRLHRRRRYYHVNRPLHHDLDQ